MSFKVGQANPAVLGDLVSDATIRTRITILTDAQIKTLKNVAGHVIVPTPGDGYLIDFMRIVLVSNIVDSYTGVDANADLKIILNGVDVAYVSNDSEFYGGGMVADLLADSGLVVLAPAVDTDAAASGTSQPLGMFAAGDLEGDLAIKLNQASANVGGGNAANTLKVITTYQVVPV